jgi:hypothetical protein
MPGAFSHTFSRQRDGAAPRPTMGLQPRRFFATLGYAARKGEGDGQGVMQKGAHAIGVEDGKAYGAKGFVIVAHVPPGKKNPKLPETVSCSTKDGDVDVPVVIERSKPFELE